MNRKTSPNKPHHDARSIKLEKGGTVRLYWCMMVDDFSSSLLSGIKIDFD
jgi:hypothetical protein